MRWCFASSPSTETRRGSMRPDRMSAMPDASNWIRGLWRSATAWSEACGTAAAAASATPSPPPSSRADPSGSLRNRARNAASDSTRSMRRAAASSEPCPPLMPPLAGAVFDDRSQLRRCARIPLYVPVDDAARAGTVRLTAARELRPHDREYPGRMAEHRAQVLEQGDPAGVIGVRLDQDDGL